MNLIADTDMGFDDVMAIAMLIALDVPVAGITTVGGLCSPQQGARNAIALLQRMDRTNIPVAAGSASPLEGSNAFPQEWIVEAEAMLGIELPSPQGKPTSESAAAFITKSAEAHPGEVSVLCLGPLTNVALAVQEGAPLKEIVLMGGAVRAAGNVDAAPDAEWNLHIDPAAAAQTFASGVPVTMIGLDVTNQAPCTSEFVSKCKAISAGSAAGKIIQESLDKMYGYFFDPVTAAFAVDPSLVTTEAMSISVAENGKTHAGMEGQSMNVGLALDFSRFQEMVSRAIGSSA